MAWIELHQSLVNHRKTLVAADILEIPPVYLVGHLTVFWLWALDNVPDGDLTNIPYRTIARVTEWPGDPDTLIDALIQAGFLDHDEDSLGIHDWHDYVGRLIGLREHHARRQSLHRDPTLKAQIRDRDQNACRYCGIEVDWKDRKGVRGGTYDHIVPHGPNTMDNVVVACRSCNSRKQQRTPEEAGIPILPIGSRNRADNLPQKLDKSTLPNPTKPNQTQPNPTKPDLTRPGSTDAAADAPEQANNSVPIIPEWLTILSELEQPTPHRVQLMTKWSEGHDGQTLKDTACQLVMKWPDVLKDNRKKTPPGVWATFQRWISVAERAPPSAHSRGAIKRRFDQESNKVDYVDEYVKRRGHLPWEEQGSEANDQ